MKLKRVEARIPEELYKKLKIEGVQENKSLNQIINESLVNRELNREINKVMDNLYYKRGDKDES